MLRFILALAFALASVRADADFTVYAAAGQSLYIRFSNNFAVDLSPGSGLSTGKYTVADAAIVGLAAGTYSGRVMVGTAAGQAQADPFANQVIPDFYWTGTAVAYPRSDLRWVGGYATIDGYTWPQLLAIIGAVAGGNIIDSATAPKIRSLDNDLNRVSATVDSAGNRTNTINVTDLP